jgi:hypothetical protein
MSNVNVKLYAQFISRQVEKDNIGTITVAEEVVSEEKKEKKPVDPVAKAAKAAKAAAKHHKFRVDLALLRVKHHQESGDNHLIHSEIVGEDGDEAGAEDHKWAGNLHHDAAKKFAGTLKYKDNPEEFNKHFKDAMDTGQEANKLTGSIGRPYNYLETKRQMNH